MQRFILQQNIGNFEKLLRSSPEPAVRETAKRLLLSHERQLALLEADEFRAQQRQFDWDYQHIAALFPNFEDSSHPLLVVRPGPRLLIVDVNEAYARATMIEREDVRNRSLFEVFPDNPDDPLSDGVKNLFASLKTVATTGEPHAMAVQRYDIRDPNGQFVIRYWQPINTPLFDENQQLVFILHHVEDVTGSLAASALQQDNQPRR
jgi:hypothetical protein